MITITSVREDQRESGVITPCAIVSEATALERLVLRELYLDSEVIQLESTAVVFRRLVDGKRCTVCYSGNMADMRPLFRVATHYFLVQYYLHPPTAECPLSAEATAIFSSGILPLMDHSHVRREERTKASKTTMFIMLRGHHFKAEEIKHLNLSQLEAIYSLLEIDGQDRSTALAAGLLAHYPPTNIPTFN